MRFIWLAAMLVGCGGGDAETGAQPGEVVSGFDQAKCEGQDVTFHLPAEAVFTLEFCTADNDGTSACQLADSYHRSGDEISLVCNGGEELQLWYVAPPEL